MAHGCLWWFSHKPGIPKLPTALFLKKVYKSSHSYHNQAGNYSRRFRVTSPSKLHLSEDQIQGLCHFPGYVGTKYLEGGERNMKRQSLDSLIWHNDSCCSFQPLLCNVSTGPGIWVTQRVGSRHREVKLVWYQQRL